jgi:hypothetical protein
MQLHLICGKLCCTARTAAHRAHCWCQLAADELALQLRQKSGIPHPENCRGAFQACYILLLHLEQDQRLLVTWLLLLLLLSLLLRLSRGATAARHLQIVEC